MEFRARLPALVALATLASGSAAAAELPSAARASEPSLTQVGKGRLTWLGFGIYEASLWTPSGDFDQFREGEPVALSLWYERGFTRQDLIDITTGEWDRLALGTVAERARWAAELERIWDDVGKGDNMTAIVVPGRGTDFYDARRRVGSIDDPAFGPAYLRIWLDSRSAVKDLRVALLGSTGAR